ncbi:16S rRNA (guanine(966)-N(2))-methyltransferase RsmD [Parvularcula flava]|uniref:Methyltransferase n=1 Tax=Aquisalinus luteolus TaxID=1566827 RepID=A0A8J3EPN8_9PROT|nr:16S rRNA (guanine(966)-N(2))-methyltransferase RsmD [Aquisalinus luteolus]NHK28628.1 16S rRNA (guanine(966)-N(2))-methyltransferase RsmD [Aquisalinus luteolus]GGH99047.1 methyltransferase [Aquisalinus luteolus]
MRIIGGQHKGRGLISPKGLSTRPTTDRVRESLYNILENGRGVDFEGLRVIDLFAGSGALGLEAMSRGASFCLFVETDAEARGVIRDNVEALSLFGNTRIHRRSATDLGTKPAGVGAPFDVAFLDAPYNKTGGNDLTGPALAALRDGNWLSDAALVIVEQSTREKRSVPDGYVEDDRRIFGDTQIGFLFRKG